MYSTCEQICIYLWICSYFCNFSFSAVLGICESKNLDRIVELAISDNQIVASIIFLWLTKIRFQIGLHSPLIHPQKIWTEEDTSVFSNLIANTVYIYRNISRFIHWSLIEASKSMKSPIRNKFCLNLELLLVKNCSENVTTNHNSSYSTRNVVRCNSCDDLAWSWKF